MLICLNAYSTARSFVGRESGPRNSPLRLKPGEFVELRTCHVC